MTKRTKPSKKLAKFKPPKFKAVVATLEREQDVLGLTGLLNFLLTIDDITTAYTNKPRLGPDICQEFFDGAANRLAKKIDALVPAIDRLQITGRTDQGSVLHALLKYAAHVGDDLEEVAAITERVRKKPITPEQQAAS